MLSTNKSPQPLLTALSTIPLSEYMKQKIFEPKKKKDHVKTENVILSGKTTFIFLCVEW